jgi:16S rRNA U1498 N3-methylase RsmE
MTRRRWIADEFSPDRAALIGAHAAHLSRTLRARVGQQFEVACGDRVRHATVASVSEERVEFTLGDEIPASADVPITLLLAIFRFDRMELAIEKCTELNVTTIIPVIARRTEKHLAIAAEKRVERWRRIAREASEQSRRVSPPEIADPRKLRDALVLLHEPTLPHSAVIPTEDFSPSGGICGPPRGSLRSVLAENEPRRREIEPPEKEPRGGGIESLENEPRRGEIEPPENEPSRGGIEPPGNEPHRGGIELSPGRKPWVGAQMELSPVGTAEKASETAHLRIVLAESEREIALSELLRPRADIASLALAVGPEGGWTEDELQSFATSQWIAASLGDTILRAETAAIAALAIARAEI